MVVVSLSLLALITNRDDGSCDEAGILAASLILSGAKAAREVEKMGEIPSNGARTVPEHSSETTSIRLKQQMSRGSHEVARRKNPGAARECELGSGPWPMRSMPTSSSSMTRRGGCRAQSSRSSRKLDGVTTSHIPLIKVVNQNGDEVWLNANHIRAFKVHDPSMPSAAFG
jgi:hypothetical protein